MRVATAACARIAERAGLPWNDCPRRAAVTRAGACVAESNRQALLGLGPVGRAGVSAWVIVAVWGQDRLWAVQDALMPHPHSPARDAGETAA